MSRLKQQIESQNTEQNLLNAITQDSAAIVIPGCKIYPMGLEIDPNTPIEKWGAISKFWKKLTGASKFWIGDWINFGEAMYGEMYSQFMDETGLAYQTLKDVRWVADKVERSRRRDRLSFEHHKEVAGLIATEQVKWLEIAEEQKLSHKRLRKSIAAGRVVDEDDESESESKDKGLKLIEGWTCFANTWIKEQTSALPVSEWEEERLEKTLKQLQTVESFIVEVKMALEELKQVKTSNA